MAVGNRRLTLLHRYNAWTLLVLFITGLLLFVPQLRGVLAFARVPLKYLHIAAGLFSVVLLAAYVPLLSSHWARLGKRLGQRLNVLLIVGLTATWAVTGTLMGFNRYMPAGWSETALLWHDLLAWLALPWAASHALTRYMRLRLIPVNAPLWEDRRIFLGGGIAIALSVVWGRFGRLFGVPGTEVFASITGVGDGLFAPAHDPLTEPSEFHPVPVSDPPKGGGSKGRFRIYSVTYSSPQFHPDSWRFSVRGLVDRPSSFSWAEFVQLPRTVAVSNFHCITGWSVYNVTWEGVRLADLLDKVGVKADARYVKFFSGDGEYTDCAPLAVARLDDVLLPYIIDGAPLPTPLGGPVRLVIPQMYGYKSVKWLQAIELIDRPHTGYWEERGYPEDAWLRKI